MNRKGSTLFIVIGIIVLIVIAGTIGYFVWKKTAMPNQASTNTVEAISSSVVTTGDGFDPTKDYGLFVANPNNDCGGLPAISYYDGGTITSGPYTGYHRIVGAPPACEPPGGDYGVLFATKDYQTFIAQGTSSEYAAAQENYAVMIAATSTDVAVNAAENEAATQWGLGEFDYNYSKVVGFGDIPTGAPPATIPLGNFVLVQNDYWYGAVPTSSPLTSLVPGLTFWGDPSQTYTGAGQASDATYLGNDNDVLIKTSSGPVFDYFLISKEEYEDASSTGLDFSWPSNGIFYQKNDISSSGSLYNTYGQIAPGACGGLDTTYLIQNISQSDLIQIGTTTGGVVLYTLKNINHPLNNDEYNSKVDGFTGAPASYADYVAKNPVLIFQDPWGRWTGLGEFDNPTPGGCGKPVIYLYPPKPTEVSIKFSTPIRFTTDIPTYANGWDVLAQPDGQLTDLQPQFTNCAAIDSTVPGSEYAQSACEKNDYPYLYWEGQASGQYPTPTGGWIVPQANISNFLNQKLTQIGLTEKETSDMMAYWVPELLKKNAPYYRMAFFQTAQMNQFIPMNISPEPNTMIRVFLDWSPLTEMPAVQPQPEILNHITRSGFTVVEWGGLKQ